MVKGFLEIPKTLADYFRQNGILRNSIFRSLLQCLISRFEVAPPNHDFLFFCATHFLYELIPRDDLDVGIQHEKDIVSLIERLAQYERKLQVERHPWTSQEFYIWTRSYLWEDADSYRIGTWARILKEHQATPNILNIDPTIWYQDNTIPSIWNTSITPRLDSNADSKDTGA